jgi:HEAT repeat protein
VTVTKKTSKPVAFGDALASLSAPGQPSAAALRAFSDLDGDRLTQWRDTWIALNPNRRAALIEQLREQAEEDIESDFRPLFRAALSDADERVRLTAIEGLYEDEHASLITPLIAILRDDPSPTVQAAAAESLGRFVYSGEMDRISESRREQVYDALMRALLLSPQASLLHRRALEALAYVSNEEVDLQIRDAFNAQNDLLRLSAIVAMGRSQNRNYRDLIRGELQSVSPAVRREAARTSGELEDDDAINDLGQLLDDPDESVRFAALDALAMIGGKDARKMIEATAASDDEAMAEHAEAALDEFDFWHGEMDFGMALFDEDEQRPNKIVKPRRSGTSAAE